MDDKTSGQIGYEAYGDAAEWKAYNGAKMPSWDEVREDIKYKWQAAAKAIIESFVSDAKEACKELLEYGK